MSLDRTFKFKHSGREWTGVPLVVANMDTVGTFEMATTLSKHKAIVAVHKHYTVEEWKEFAAKEPEAVGFVAASAGTRCANKRRGQKAPRAVPPRRPDVSGPRVRSAADMQKLDAILAACPGVTMVCLDVANGYSEFFVEAVKTVRKKHPNHTLIAGNVVTNEMTEELILHGADIVKVPRAFHPTPARAPHASPCRARSRRVAPAAIPADAHSPRPTPSCAAHRAAHCGSELVGRGEGRRVRTLAPHQRADAAA